MEPKKMESDSSHPSGDDSVARFGSEVPARPTSPAEFAHTPGPWNVVESHKFPFPISVVSEGGSVLVVQDRIAFSSRQETLEECMAGIHMGPDQRDAARLNLLQVGNLRLIAAAPDLLAALKGLVERGTDSPEHLAAERAIAKATGAPQ